VPFTNRPDVPDAWFIDELDGLLANAVYNNDAKATAGSVRYEEVDARKVVLWEGPLQAGSKVTVTFSVTVRPGASGQLDNRVLSSTFTNNCGWDIPQAPSLDPAMRRARGCSSTVTVG
jgi:hypothetical protein